MDSYLKKDSITVKKKCNNKFELKTSKGKALQFIITSDDPSESDIEEVKSILNSTRSKEEKHLIKNFI